MPASRRGTQVQFFTSAPPSRFIDVSGDWRLTGLAFPAAPTSALLGTSAVIWRRKRQVQAVCLFVSLPLISNKKNILEKESKNFHLHTRASTTNVYCC